MKLGFHLFDENDFVGDIADVGTKKVFSFLGILFLQIISTKIMISKIGKMCLIGYKYSWEYLYKFDKNERIMWYFY